MRLEARLASSMLWVTIIIVTPDSATLRITASTSLVIVGSSAEVGSSRSRICGSMANARTIATRCYCPPESSSG